MEVKNGGIEIVVDRTKHDSIQIIPKDDIILELVWSTKHERLICIARELYV